LKQLPANPKLPTTMMQANPKFVMGRPMLTVNVLHKAGKPCMELHNYYINNYMSGQDIIVSYKESHILVGDGIFLISWSDLYNLFNLDALDVSLMCCFALQVRKNWLLQYVYSIYVLYVSNKFGTLRVGTCNNKHLIKWERSLLHILIHK
jgi:hypothetical protein